MGTNHKEINDMVHRSSHIIIDMRRHIDAVEKELAKLKELLEELEKAD